MSRNHAYRLIPLLFALYLIALIVWKTALWLHLPLPTTDGVQSLSHTYSLLRGEPLLSSLWHNWMPIYQLPYGFGAAASVILALLPFDTINSYFAASLLFALSGAAAAWLLLRSARGVDPLTSVIAALAVFVYPSLWTMRPEALTIPLLLLALTLIARTQGQPPLRTILACAFLVAFSGIAHPLAGLIGVIALTAAGLERGWHLRALITVAAAVGAFAAALYLPVILVDPDQWSRNFLGFFTREEPRGLSSLTSLDADALRFIGWGAPLVILYGRALLIQAQRQPRRLLLEAALALLFTLPILFGGGGSYFTYLILLMIWRLTRLPNVGRPRLALAAGLLLILPFFSHYFPTFQQLENPRYGETARAVLAEIDRYSGRSEPGLVWTSVRLALPIIDEPYARVIANYYELGRYPEPIPIRSEDVLLSMWAVELDTIFINYALNPDTARVEIIIEPVEGLLTFESLLRARLPSLGLWRITAER